MTADSPEVIAPKLRLACPELRDGSDWASDHRKWLHKQIRAQRLIEARSKGTHTADEWSAVLAHFSYRCVRCGCTPEGRPCKDHIKPIYQGGSDAIDNLQPLCRQCNTAKGPDCFNWAAYRDEHGFEDCDE